MRVASSPPLTQGSGLFVSGHQICPLMPYHFVRFVGLTGTAGHDIRGSESFRSKGGPLGAAADQDASFAIGFGKAAPARTCRSLGAKPLHSNAH